MARILAVIPAHNRRQTTLGIISDVKALRSPGFQLDVLVVDDGSTDGTGQAILDRFPDVKVEYGDGNLWWGGALNVGYRYALKHNYDYVYVLNDDNILREDTLSQLYSEAKDNPKTICGSVVLNESGRVISAGFRFSSFLGKVLNPWKNRPYESLQKGLLPCETLSTRSTLVPADVLTQGILMDDVHFPHNYSDYDFFDRARRAGFSLVVVTRSVVVAGESTSNFHYFIVDHTIKQIMSSFFDIKYGINFKNQWNIASRNANGAFVFVRFIAFIFPAIVWFIMRCILPRRRLVTVLEFFGKYQRSAGG